MRSKLGEALSRKLRKRGQAAFRSWLFVIELNCDLTSSDKTSLHRSSILVENFEGCKKREIIEKNEIVWKFDLISAQRGSKCAAWI
jgi:hypothetical protein